MSDETNDYPVLRLRPGREYAIRSGHPWLFSGAFREIPPGIEAGAVVDVLASGGEWVARGHLTPQNSLAFRVLTREREEAIDEQFYRRRFERALALRRLLPPDVTAYRLAHAEADEVPGLVVDRYDRWLVAQFSTAGVERQRATIIAALVAVLGADGVEGILTRDDLGVRTREGLALGGASVAFGTVPEAIEVREGPVYYQIDTLHGQKTGFFLDQREKRARIAALAPNAATLLNCFAYSGGFALAGLAGNPALHTVNVDSSGPALHLARRNYTLNGHDPAAEAHSFVEGDVMRYLHTAAEQGQRFDIVVVDPPAYAKSLPMKERALHGYEALNAHAAHVVVPGGLMLTCSCSGAVDYAEFETAVRLGLAREGRRAQVLEIFGPSLDHPTVPGYIEDRYLKALLLRVY